MTFPNDTTKAIAEQFSKMRDAVPVVLTPHIIKRVDLLVSSSMDRSPQNVILSIKLDITQTMQIAVAQRKESTIKDWTGHEPVTMAFSEFKLQRIYHQGVSHWTIPSRPGIRYKLMDNCGTHVVAYAIDDAGTFIFRELIENEEQMVTIYFDATK